MAFIAKIGFKDYPYWKKKKKLEWNFLWYIKESDEIRIFPTAWSLNLIRCIIIFSMFLNYKSILTSKKVYIRRLNTHLKDRITQKKKKKTIFHSYFSIYFCKWNIFKIYLLYIFQKFWTCTRINEFEGK